MQDQSSASKLDEYLTRLSQNDSTCTIIDLSNCHIGEKNLNKLAQALTNTPTTITELNLSGNHIKPESIKWLHTILACSPNLKKLNLSNTHLANQVVQVIVSKLERNQTLTELDLSHNHLTAESVSVDNENEGSLSKLLQYNHTLRTLNLSGNKLGDAGAVALATTLYKNNTTLVALELSENGIGPQGVAAFANSLVVNRSLQYLDLSYNDIWDEDTDAFVEAFKSRTELAIEKAEEEEGEGEKKEDQEKVARFQLNLRGNWISPEQARQLLDIATEEKCDLHVNNQRVLIDKRTQSDETLLSDKVIFLGNLTRDLADDSKIDLSHSNLDDQKIKPLLGELRKNTQLTELNILHNKLSAKGINDLLSALLNKHQLIRVDLSHNWIGPEEVESLTKLFAAYNQLETLLLAGNRLGDKGIQQLAESLHNNMTLHYLDLSENEISEVGTKALECMLYDPSAITSLDLSHNHLNNEGAAALGRVVNTRPKLLKALNLAYNDCSDISLLADTFALGSYPSLTDLNLSGNPIEADSLAIIADSLYQIYVSHFENWKNIKKLSLHFSNCQIYGKKTKEIATLMHSIFHLEFLDLSHNALDFKGYEIITAALSSPSFLPFRSPIRLNLSDTGLNDVTVELLVNSLCSLERRLDKEGLSVYVLQNFIQELDLSKNKIGYRGLKAIKKLTKYHCEYMGCLYYMDLSDNEIGDPSIYVLSDIVGCHARKIPPTPMKFGINLQRNKITAAGIVLLLKKTKVEANYKLLVEPQQLVEKNVYQTLTISSTAHKNFQANDQSSLSYSSSSVSSSTSSTSVSSGEKPEELSVNISASNASSAAPHDTLPPKIITASPEKPVSKPTLVAQQSVSASSKHTGPRQIPGWELQDVPAQGNCFYEAVVHQFHQIHHAFLNTVPAGTAPRDSLRLRIQGREFNDGEWADEEQIILLALQFNVIVAIADTRYPANHFRYLYFDEKGDYKYANNPALLPKEKSIIQLAFTGNHYLSVVHALPRPDLHQRINMLRQADVQKVDAPQKIDMEKKSDAPKGKLQERMERLRREHAQKEKKAADTYPVINFSDLNIGDQGAERLAMRFKDNEVCTYLDLSNTGMGDRGFEKFVGVMCQNGVLAELYFEDNRISVEGTKFFGAILARNKTLKIISLSGNSLGDEGVKALAAGISYNTTLECLMLSGNDLTSNGIKYLVEAIFDKKNIKVLDLSHNKIGYEGMSILTRLVHQGIITHLDISHSGVWSQDVKGLTETLKTNTTLQFLDLSGNKIENDAARLLAMAVREAGNAALIEGGLYFGKPRIPTKDEKREEDEVAVTEKEDASPKFVTAEELTILLQRARRASLPCLDEPDPARIAALQIQLKTLEENKSSSTFLNFSNDSIGDVGVQRLAETLHDKETLQSLALALSQCHIGDAGIVTLAARLDANPHIQLVSLDLSNNSIGADGAMGLTLVMSQRTLVYLNLRHNQLGPHGVGRLMMGFHGDQTLQYLDLSSNILHDEGAIKLAKTLCVINALIVLKISNNQIGNKGAAALATALELSKTLTELDLSDNELNHEGMKALADAFFKHTAHLENLNLAHNDIGVKGAKVLRDGLCGNHCLWYLNIDKNNIGNKGADHIAHLLKHNTALRKLNLKRNAIGVKSTLKFSNALAKNTNTRLTEIDFEGNKLWDVRWEVVNVIFWKNYFMHVIESVKEAFSITNPHSHLSNDLIKIIISYDNGIIEMKKTKESQEKMLQEVWKRISDEELAKTFRKTIKNTLWGMLKQGFFGNSSGWGPSGGQPPPAPQSRF